MDRISPAALRYVLIGLVGCAGVGLWMGLNNEMRRDTPNWTGGGSAPAQASGPPEASPYEAGSAALTSPPAAESAETKAAESKPAAAPEPAEVETADLTDRTPTTPEAKPSPPPAKTPAPKAPPAKAPAAKPAPDPIGDLVEERTTPADPPPEVPF